MENLFSSPLMWGLSMGILLALFASFIAVCYFILAPKHIFFTFGKENYVMFIMYGESFSGKIIFPSRTLYADENYFIKKLGRGVRKQKSFLGMYWVGFWPFYKVHFRHQQWLEWESTKDGRVIRFRNEMTPYLIAIPFEYAMLLTEAEDKNGLPLSVYFTVIIEPNNVVHPIFGADDAYGQVQTICLGVALPFIKKNTFANLGKREEVSDEKSEAINSAINDEFCELLCKLNEEIPGRFKKGNGKEKIGLLEALQYRILDAKINQIEVTGPYKEEALRATTAKYVAEENANAEVATAQGNKQATILRGEGNKAAGLLGIDVEKYSMEVRNDFYEKIKDKTFAQKIELAKKMFEDSNLTTFVSGKDVTPTIDVDNMEDK